MKVVYSLLLVLPLFSAPVMAAEPETDPQEAPAVNTQFDFSPDADYTFDEQAYMEEPSRTLPTSFREATANCEPSVADLKMLYESEHVEMLGWKDDKCHLSYRNFDLYVPKEKLAELLTFDDITDLVFSLPDAEYNYQNAYNYDGLMFELASCYRKTEPVENHRQRMHFGEKMEITNGVLRQDNENSCKVELVNTLTLESKTTDYGVICEVPNEELEAIIAPYLKYADEFGEKSFENADGNMEWHGSTSTDQTRRIDAKLLYTLQTKNYCKLKNAPDNKEEK